VTALCNQPEAVASDLGDDQSCYLYFRAQPKILRHHQCLSWLKLSIQLSSQSKYLLLT